MSTAACPRCGLTDFGSDEQGLADAGVWAEEFVCMCEHVHERGHLKDLRTHTCPALGQGHAGRRRGSREATVSAAVATMLQRRKAESPGCRPAIVAASG